MGSSIIVIEGELSSGEKISLVQHVSQLNFSVVRVSRKANGTLPRRKIGFLAE